MKIAYRNAIAALVAALFIGKAGAWDFNALQAHVTIVEASYLPNSVSFQIDQNAGNCSAGAWLNYNAVGATVAEKAANASGIMSALLAAQATGSTVVLFGYNGSCTVDHIWIKRI